MNYPVLSSRVSQAHLVSLRDRTRQIGDLFGLDRLQCTRFITSVSEIARNVVQYAQEGSIAFFFQEADAKNPQLVVAVLSDKGPGIADIPGAIAGRSTREGHAPLGIPGTNRLVDELVIETPKSGGTRVTLKMALPRHAPVLDRTRLGQLVEQLAQQKPNSAVEELEKQNREMLDALDQLREKQRELELADKRKNHFLAALAHELRNPLGTLGMVLQIINRDPVIEPAKLTKHCQTMSRQTDQISKLVEDLLDAVRIGQGKLALAKCRLDLNTLVSDAIEMTSSAVSAKRHDIVLNASLEEVWVDADPTRLRQVLCNLIQNAARYTPPGGHIAVNVTSSPALAQVEVIDNGIGIDAQVLPTVFDLFVQGNTEEGTSVGLGVGLTLVKHLVRQHGGEVQAISEGSGRGSRFVISLPTALPIALSLAA